MKTHTLGASGIEASVVAFGAWAIGGWKWGGTDATAAVEALHAALDAGVTLIDTAPVYGFGLSEELVGEALKSRRREDVVIATKCGLVWGVEDGPALTLHGSASPDKPIFRTNARASIRAEVDASLARLGTDYIDLYFTHWQDPQVSGAEVMETFEELKREGKIRAAGACNASLADLASYASVAPLDADQEKYSALDRAQEATNLPYAAESGMAYLAYSPMAQGLLTGKITPERVFPDGDIRHDNPRYSLANRRAVAGFLDGIAGIAADHKARVEHVMLAWTLARPGMTHVLVGARNADQARSNAMAGRLELSGAEIADIDAALADLHLG